MQDEKLKAYFKFDDSDLQANHEGHFSEKQRDYLIALDRSDRSGRTVTGIICLGLALAGLIGALWLLFSGQDLIVKLLAGVGLGLFWPLVSGGLGLYLLRSSSSSNRKYKLGQVQGRISYSRHINRRTRNPVYGYQLLHVKTMRFDVSEHMSDLMPSDQEYLVYYYTRQGLSKIVSAELIEQAS